MSEIIDPTQPNPAAQQQDADMDAHHLMPAYTRARIPVFYTTEGAQDPTVWLKWFTPDSNWTWYVIEFDGTDECFGITDGHETEAGYFYLSAIEGLRGPLGLKVERDLYFRPRPISEVSALDEWRA